MADLVQSTLDNAGSNRVVIFSKSTCPYCTKAKDDLSGAGIIPVVIELDERQDGDEIQNALMERTGQKSVPSVWVCGRHIGGSDDLRNQMNVGLFDALPKQKALAPVKPSNFGGSSASVGDSLPSVELHQGFPPKMHNLADFAKDKNIILVGLPGAFTPTWSTRQIPNYLENQDALRKAGIHTVIVYCVNDAAVMQAWAKDQKVESSMLQLMGDPAGELTKALDMELTHPGPLSVGIIGRCKRFAMYVVNGEIKAINVAESENDPAGDSNPESTLSEAMLIAILEATK